MRRLAIAKFGKSADWGWIVEARVEIRGPGDYPTAATLRSAVDEILNDRWPGDFFSPDGPDRVAHVLALGLQARYSGDRYISVSVHDDDQLGAAVVFDPALRLGDRA